MQMHIVMKADEPAKDTHKEAIPEPYKEPAREPYKEPAREAVQMRGERMLTEDEIEEKKEV